MALLPTCSETPCFRASCSLSLESSVTLDQEANLGECCPLLKHLLQRPEPTHRGHFHVPLAGTALPSVMSCFGFWGGSLYVFLSVWFLSDASLLCYFNGLISSLFKTINYSFIYKGPRTHLSPGMGTSQYSNILHQAFLISIFTMTSCFFFLHCCTRGDSQPITMTHCNA